MGKVIPFKRPPKRPPKRRPKARRRRRWTWVTPWIPVLALVALAVVGNRFFNLQFVNPARHAVMTHSQKDRGGEVVVDEPIVGPAMVVDGDTVDIYGTRIRLFGIDAPEIGQPCILEGEHRDCGRLAARALGDKIGFSTLHCRPRAIDDTGRVVAVCSVSGEEVNAWMVAQGWAMAYRQYSMVYLWQEKEASAKKRGLWRGSFQAPWDWRHENAEGG